MTLPHFSNFGKPLSYYNTTIYVNPFELLIEDKYFFDGITSIRFDTDIINIRIDSRDHINNILNLKDFKLKICQYNKQGDLIEIRVYEKCNIKSFYDGFDINLNIDFKNKEIYNNIKQYYRNEKLKRLL